MAVTIQRLCSVCKRVKPCVHTKQQYERARGAIRGGSTARLYDYRWQQARRRFLREHTQCVKCLTRGIITAATIVDHRIPHDGNALAFWDETNWQPLCKFHHDQKTRLAQRSKGGGVR